MAVAYVASLVLALQLAGVGGLTDEPAQAEPVVVAPSEPAPPRPSSLPKTIPAWAWAVYRWHDAGADGMRPAAAPRTLPRWYWEWRAWRRESGA